MTHMGSDNQGRAIQAIRPGRVQQLAVGAVSAQLGLGFLADTTVVRVVCDVPCHYSLAATALVTDSLLPAGVVEYINVSRGEKLAFIREGAVSGLAYVTEGS